MKYNILLKGFVLIHPAARYGIRLFISNVNEVSTISADRDL